MAALAFVWAAAHAPEQHPARSITPLIAGETAPVTFDGEHAAALFVGVRTFDHRLRPEVPYAVDDAVDLAYLFAFDRRVSLVAPRRIVLALAGTPEKEISRSRLEELTRDGARVIPARHAGILEAMKQQAALAGESGLLVVSFATHGVDEKGIWQVLDPAGAEISTADVQDIARQASRSLILIDACRSRITGRGRGVAGTPTASAKLTHHMRSIHGQVVLSTTGEAYDDRARQNGVFTATVIEGLQCKASHVREQVTAQTLSTYVEKNVRSWIRKHVNRGIRSATSITLDLQAKNMPLAFCGVASFPSVFLEADASTLRVFSKQSKKLLWKRQVSEAITQTAQADGTIAAGTRHSLFAFDVDGTPTWSQTSTAPLHALVAANLFRKPDHHFVALWGSHIAIYDARGELLSTADAPETLHHVAIYSTTPFHAPRIVVAGTNRLLLYDPKKLAAGKPLWSAHLFPRSETIANLKTTDYNHDTKREIAITTSSGARLYLDAKGRVVGGAKERVRARVEGGR